MSGANRLSSLAHFSLGLAESVSSSLGSLVAVLGGCSSPEDRAQFHYERGVALAKDGETAKAAVEFRNALALDEDIVPALYAIGEIEQAADRLNEAANYFQRVRELDPGNVDARVRLATILATTGSLDDASKIEDEARILGPKRPDVLVLGASLALKAHDTGRAVEACRGSAEGRSGYAGRISGARRGGAR